VTIIVFIEDKKIAYRQNKLCSTQNVSWYMKVLWVTNTVKMYRLKFWCSYKPAFKGCNDQPEFCVIL